MPILLRILRFPLTLLLIETVVIGTVATLYSTALHLAGIDRNGPANLVGALGLAIVLIGLWKLGRRWLEGDRDRELPLRRALPELGQGLAGGFLLFSAMAGIVMALGGLDVLGIRGTGAIWPMLAMAVVSGTFEELLFRGILFRHVEAMLGTWAALAITSALFGAAHLANPDSSPFAAFAIMMEAGILLGAAYMVTRRLWVPIGIHAAWNFTQGWVFSVPVSGGEAPLGLLITRRVGPEWLTGGDFGLEASLVAMVLATLAGLFLLWRAVRQGRLIAPIWQRKKAQSQMGESDAVLQSARRGPADAG